MTGGTTGTSTGGTTGTSTGGSGAGGLVTSTGGAGGTSSTGTGGSTSSTAGGTIVPLYTDPSDSSWKAIVTAAVAHPTVHVVAIVNPADGPGSSKSSGYTSGIAALQAAHIEVIGYVATGYGSHSIASMESQIDQWKAFYPTLQGIFFDEQSNSASDVAHYKTLSQYAKSVGLSYTVGNPGTDVPAAYIGALDTMLIYESDGVPSVSSLAQWSSYPPGNFGIIPYNVSAMSSTFVKQARQYVGYVYLQNDNVPNPWDSLPSYFASTCWPRSSNAGFLIGGGLCPPEKTLVEQIRVRLSSGVGPREGRKPLPRRRSRSLAVALGLFVVGQIGEGADQVDDLLALLGRQIDELHAHAGVDVVVAARAERVHPHHPPLEIEARAALGREAEIELGPRRLGGVGADEDAHRADVGDVREQEVVGALVVDLDVDRDARVDAAVGAAAVGGRTEQ